MRHAGLCAVGLLVLVQDSVCIMDSIVYRGFGDLGSAKLSPCHMRTSGPPSGSFHATFREKAEVPFPHQPRLASYVWGLRLRV